MMFWPWQAHAQEEGGAGSFSPEMLASILEVLNPEN